MINTVNKQSNFYDKPNKKGKIGHVTRMGSIAKEFDEAFNKVHSHN